MMFHIYRPGVRQDSYLERYYVSGDPYTGETPVVSFFEINLREVSAFGRSELQLLVIARQMHTMELLELLQRSRRMLPSGRPMLRT